MKTPLTGIVPPLATPLLAGDQLDTAGLDRLIEHVLAGGVSGLFLLGTTGEGPSLSYRLRREVVERACKQVARRVPVLVAITDTIFAESIAMARHAADCGADAVVVAPPYYLPAGQPELSEYIEHLVAALPLPLMLYNMPALTKVVFEPDTLKRAMDEPRIIGLKDSSANMLYFNRVLGILSQRPDWSLMIGPEELLMEALLLGGHGGVSGGANVFPALYVKLCADARAPGANHERVRELHRQVLRVSGNLYGVGRHSSAVIKGIKCALSCLGICDDFMAEPFHRFREPERKRIAAAVEQLKDEINQLLS
ncbi:MAG: dihydrodipicolinate synthase family protein [Chthoniobacteraceae bacterium]